LVVCVPFDVVPRGRDQLVKHRRVDRCGVGDHLNGDDLRCHQRPFEESARRLTVAPRRDKHVDDLPVLVHRPVDVAPDAVDLHIGFVHEPSVTGRMPAEPGRVGEQWREPLNPAKHRDVIDLDTALSQQLLDVAIRQAVPQVPPDRHHDHVRRKPKPSEGRTRWHQA
jgi:hypothetical protein